MMMEVANLSLEQSLKEAVAHCADETGWANLAEIGTYLRSKGVKYGKLSRFVSNYPYSVETKMDTSVVPPAVYARVIKHD
jgi:hypothetical protein